MTKFLKIATVVLMCMLSSLKVNACHGVTLLNYNFAVGPMGITINANSDPATCGCGPYYMEIELSCTPGGFTGAAPACAAGTWNTALPNLWYHSILNIPGYTAPNWFDNCIIEPYTAAFIPFTNLCPGSTYWFRARERPCTGTVGPWTAINSFIVPGGNGPPVLSINASTTTVCPPNCANLTANVTGGCPANNWTYSWSGGLGVGPGPKVACPAVTTNYVVTATPVCGVPITQNITINVLPAAIAGVANISNISVCPNSTVNLSLVGSSGTIQWQSAPNVGGPWNNILGATNPNHVANITANTCFRAIVSACGTATSNIVCVTLSIPPPMTVSITNPLCFGGVGSATAIVGFNTYTWSSSANNTNIETGLPIGTYTVSGTTVAGCTNSAIFNITQPTPIVLTTTVINTTCGQANGSATVNATGGNGPYTYTWNTAPVQNTPIATNILAGVYTVTVSGVGGCTTTAVVNILNTGAPLVTIPTTVNVSCFGGNNGSANSNVVGGVAPYTYTWNSTPVQNTPNATNLTAGNYTLTVSGANGCTASAVVTITQPTQLAATTSQTNVLCFGGNNGLASVSPSGGTAPYIYMWSNAQVTQTATNLTAGNYTCTIIDFNGCLITKTFVITQPTQLTAINSQTNILCFGGNATASVTPSGGTPPYSYLWSNAQTTQSVMVLAGNYTCTIADANGCQVINTFVIAQPTQLASVISMTPTTCGLPNGSASVAPSGGVGPYTYLWSNAQTSQAINTILAGTYTCTITDANGCQVVQTIVVPNTGAPTVTIPTTVNVSCFGGNNGSANSNVVGGVPPYTYLWSNAQITANATNLTAGSYTLTVTGNNGCSSSATVTITQPTQLTGAITTTNVSCFGGNNGSAIVTPVGGVGPYTYLWSNAQITQTASNLILGIYTCTVTDLNGCQISVAANITQPTLLTLSLASQTNILCFGGTNGALTVTGSGGTGLYLYSLNNGPNQVSPTFTNLTAGTYTIRATDANSCIATTTVTLTQPTALTITGGVTWVTCFNACDGELLANVGGGTPGYTYLWSNGATTNPAIGLCAANYSVLVTDANGCQIAMTFILGQPNLLTVGINGLPTSICIDQQSTLSSNVNGGTPAYTYTWSNGSNNANTTVSPTTTTTYSVQITDANGCTATNTVVISVNPPLNVSAIISPSVICAGKSTSLTASGSGGTGGPYTYMWSPGGTGQSIVVTPSVTTTYTVSLSDGCSPVVTATLTAFVNQLPIVTYTTSKLSGCDPLVVNFNNTTPGSTSCNWNMSPYNMIGCNTSYTFNTGTYTVSLSVTDVNGCSATSSSFGINVYDIPVASFSANPTTTDIDNSSVQFTNLSTPGANMWSFGDGNSSISTNPLYTYNNIGYYNVQLTVTTFAGCQAVANGTIHIKDVYSFWVPNAFTPNDSGTNDYFYPVVMGYKSYTMSIFNRWGEQIYNGVQDGKWDGTYNGVRVKDDVYVWKINVIDLNGIHHEYVGHVTLMK